MCVNIGIDIVEVSRMQQIVEKWKDVFLNRVFTHDEIACARSGVLQYQRLAARFAAKEATRKAFGAMVVADAAWTDIEVHNEFSGMPVIRLHGRMKALQESMCVTGVIVSMSHTRQFAIASALLIRNTLE